MDDQAIKYGFAGAAVCAAGLLAWGLLTSRPHYHSIPHNQPVTQPINITINNYVSNPKQTQATPAPQPKVTTESIDKPVQETIVRYVPVPMIDVEFISGSPFYQGRGLIHRNGGYFYADGFGNVSAGINIGNAGFRQHRHNNFNPYMRQSQVYGTPRHLRQHR